MSVVSTIDDAREMAMLDCYEAGITPQEYEKFYQMNYAYEEAEAALIDELERNVYGKDDDL